MKKNLLIIFCLALFSFSCKNGNAKANVSPQEKIKLIPVKVASFTRGPIKRTLSTSGDIKPIAEANITAKIGGEIKEVFAEEGDKLEKGSVLLKIDDFHAKKEKERAEASLIGASARYQYAQETAEKTVAVQLKDAEANLKTAKAAMELICKGARDEEIKQIKSEKDSAEAVLNNIKGNYDRVKNLWDNKLVSQQEWEKIQTELKTAQSKFDAVSEQYNILVKGARDEDIKKAEAQVDKATAAYELAKQLYDSKSWYKDLKSASAFSKEAQASFDLASKAVDDTEIKAPFSGTIMKKNANIGENIKPEQVVFSIMDFSKIKVEANIAEANITEIKAGQAVNIKLDAYPGKVFHGKVNLISPGIDSKNRTAKIEILAPNEDNLIRPGMFAQVEIITKENFNANILPRESLVEKEEKKGVFVVENGTAIFKNVQAGTVTDEKFEVLSGINKNDKVVVKGVSDLWDGIKVEVIQ
ncbi:MAG: efflux RND transporter periplasmic adaptor subunit [bacterium]